MAVENWEIRDPRGSSNSQSFSSQISENSVINIRDPVFNKQWYLVLSTGIFDLFKTIYTFYLAQLWTAVSTTYYGYQCTARVESRY